MDVASRLSALPEHLRPVHSIFVFRSVVNGMFEAVISTMHCMLRHAPLLGGAPLVRTITRREAHCTALIGS